MKIQFDNSKVDFRVTPLENIFLETYLTSAPANALRVYIYGWMHSYKGDNEGLEADELSWALGMTSDDLVEALSFWMDRGLIKEDSEDGQVKFKFLSMLLLYSGYYDRDEESKEGKEKTAEAQKAEPGTNEKETMFKGLEDFLSEGRPYRVELKANEIRQALDILDKYPINPDFFLYAYKKAASTKEASSRSFNYLTAIVENWIRFENLDNREDLDNFLKKEEEAKVKEGKKSRSAKTKGQINSTTRKSSREEDRAWVREALERSRRKSLRGDNNEG